MKNLFRNYYRGKTETCRRLKLAGSRCREMRNNEMWSWGWQVAHFTVVIVI